MRARSLLLTGPRRLEWHVSDLPSIGPDAVLIETLASTISSGTELPHYRGASRDAQPHNYPRMTGYESVGLVREVGSAVTTLQPGQRVFSFYGHRDRAIVPAGKAIPVPDDIADPLALLAILSCDVGKGLKRLQPQPGDAVLVSGLGAIGLLAVWTLATRYGARPIALDPLPERRELAYTLGAAGASHPDELPPGAYPLGVECSSRDRAFALLQQHLAPSSRICVLSDGNLEPLELTPHFHAKELTVYGSSDGDDYHAHAAWFFLAARPAAARLAALFQHTTTADDLPSVFAELARGAIAPVKVLVQW